MIWLRVVGMSASAVIDRNGYMNAINYAGLGLSQSIRKPAVFLDPSTRKRPSGFK